MNPTQQFYENTLKDVKQAIRQCQNINSVEQHDWIIEVQRMLNQESDDLQSQQPYNSDAF